MNEMPQDSHDTDGEKKDLFEDLRGKNDNQIRKEIDILQTEVNNLTQNFDHVGDELNEAISLFNSLIGIIDFNEHNSLRTEARQTALDLKEMNQEFNRLTSIRNQINNQVGLRSHRCEDELKKVFFKLTENIDVFRVSSIEREEQWFSYFFELKEMYLLMVKADEAHKKLEELFEVRKKTLRRYKEINEELSEMFKEAMKDEKLPEGVELKYSNLGEIQKSIVELKKVRNKSYRLRKKANRERGRLQAFIKYSNKNKTNRRKRKKIPRPSSKEVNEKISTGGSITLEELDVFLKSGGLNQLPSSTTNSVSTSKRKKKEKSKVKVVKSKPAKSKKGFKD